MVIRGLGDAFSPPPYEAAGTDFDSDMAVYLDSKDSFAVTASYPATASSGGWGDWFSDLGKSILTGATKSATALINGRAVATTTAPASAATSSSQMLLIGGVAAAVVVGALVLRRRRR